MAPFETVPPKPRPAAHPDGHFYSPVTDPTELAQHRERIWPADPEILGIDFAEASHLRILEEVLPRHLGEYDYPEHAPEGTDEDGDDHRFYTQNSQFTWLDARALFAFMREWRPARVIEVGSGYSSLLMADVNRRFLGGRCAITCVEPHPRPFLQRGVPGIGRLIQAKVQDVPLETFAELESGDVLFIDSSHVSKTGSDVNHLYFEVLPRLARGVRVHVHDIFLPHDYLQAWAIAENRSWNEQYLLRALLMYSNGFRVVFGCSHAFHRWPDKVKTALAHPKGHAFAGGSFWMERA